MNKNHHHLLCFNVETFLYRTNLAGNLAKKYEMIKVVQRQSLSTHLNRLVSLWKLEITFPGADEAKFFIGKI